MAGSAPDLRDLLIYLDEIGYGELFLPSPAVRDAPAARPAASPLRETAPARETAPSSRSAPPSHRDVAQRPSPAPPPSPPRTPAPPPTAEAGERTSALAAVAEEAAGCELCRLCQTRRTVVFGTGDPDADLMFIGEGPGAEEDRRGLPFVGPAGELLDRIVRAIGFERDQVYIANVVKCRPPGNRDPQADEVAACRSYLERQIELVQPRVIVALGRVAAQTLLGNDSPLGRMRGRWWTVAGVPTRVTYHPAALLRNAAWKRPTWEDMQVVRDRLADSP